VKIFPAKHLYVDMGLPHVLKTFHCTVALEKFPKTIPILGLPRNKGVNKEVPRDGC
jgi:hypothetical protein